MRTLLAILTTLAGSCLAISAAWAQITPVPVGNEACKTCHVPYEAHKVNIYHSDCLACHKPQDKHLAEGGRGTVSLPAAENCLACHQNNDHKRMNWAFSPHAKAKLDCRNCHGVHSPKVSTTRSRKGRCPASAAMTRTAASRPTSPAGTSNARNAIRTSVAPRSSSTPRWSRTAPTATTPTDRPTAGCCSWRSRCSACNAIPCRPSTAETHHVDSSCGAAPTAIARFTAATATRCSSIDRGEEQ